MLFGFFTPLVMYFVMDAECFFLLLTTSSLAPSSHSWPILPYFLSVTKYQKNTRRPIVTKKEVGREREVVVVKNKIVKPSVNIMKVVQKQGWPLRRSTSYLLVFMLSDFERDYLLKVQLICPKCKNKRTSEISSWSSVELVEFLGSIRSIVFQNNSFKL